MLDLTVSDIRIQAINRNRAKISSAKALLVSLHRNKRKQGGWGNIRRRAHREHIYLESARASNCALVKVRVGKAQQKHTETLPCSYACVQTSHWSMGITINSRDGFSGRQQTVETKREPTSEFKWGFAKSNYYYIYCFLDERLHTFTTAHPQQEIGNNKRLAPSLRFFFVLIKQIAFTNTKSCNASLQL